jgi:diacylglycerol kinase
MTRISFIDSTFCAIKGLFRGVLKERNIKIQFLIMSVFVIIAIVSGISRFYLAIILIVCLFGIILELLNTTFERFIDLVSPEYNKEVGKFKDEMAGVVLLTSSIAVIISCFILYTPIMKILTIIEKSNLLLFLAGINAALILIVLLIDYLRNKS